MPIEMIISDTGIPFKTIDPLLQQMFADAARRRLNERECEQSGHTPKQHESYGMVCTRCLLVIEEPKGRWPRW